MSPLTAAIPSLTPEQRHAVATGYERAVQWLAAQRPQQALPLLQDCCRIDPTNLSYRQALRNAQHHLRLQQPMPALAVWLATWRQRRRLRKALTSGRWLDALELAEGVLAVDPKNVEAHGALALAFERLGWIDQAVFCLEQARSAIGAAATFDQDLARLYELRGSFTQATTFSGPQPPERDDLETFRRDLAIVDDKLRNRPDDVNFQQIRDRLAHEVDSREISLLQQKADRFPEELSYRFDLGVRLLKAAYFEAALAAFEQARADPRLRWRCLVYAAYCHMNCRKWALAKPLLEEALPLIPETEMMRKEVSTLLANGLDVKRS